MEGVIYTSTDFTSTDFEPSCFQNAPVVALPGTMQDTLNFFVVAFEGRQ
jgi:hypothetical protein